MNCSRCHHEISEGANYCPACGERQGGYNRRGGRLLDRMVSYRDALRALLREQLAKHEGQNSAMPVVINLYRRIDPQLQRDRAL